MSLPPAESAFLRDGAPDWDAIDFDVTCVRCGYNLKLLGQPRCPECGLEFEWAQVVTYHQQSSDFLFEHQWRRLPIRSLLLTLTRAAAALVLGPRVDVR